MSEIARGIKRLSDYVYEIPASAKSGMRVPARLYVNEKLLVNALDDRAVEQLENIAFLPGIVGSALAMPDIHLGYGFPIGGVAAVDAKHGVVSPGGVGFDINCGVRLLRTDLTSEGIAPVISTLMDKIFKLVPKGVGTKGDIHLSDDEMAGVLSHGAQWAIERGYGRPEDSELIEEQGVLRGARLEDISSHAKERGRDQLGTLGAGNHFMEVQEVVELFDESRASVFGLFKGQIVVMIHSGSRGLGHQVCSDYVKTIEGAGDLCEGELPDKQLAFAPIESKVGKAYLSAMTGAVNYAFANRQCLTHLVRRGFEEVLKGSAASLGMDLVYDVAHNIAKYEEHHFGGTVVQLLVHRKGATRAFGPGQPGLPTRYLESGQPVIIPGDMGSASYVLAGTEKAMQETFGSTCHGAGRVLSRSKAKKMAKGIEVKEALREAGIHVRAANVRLLAEEAPSAYKDISEVVEVCHGAGISKKVARTRPLGVVKG